MKLFGTSGIRAVFSRDLLDLAFKVGVAVGGSYRSVVVGTDTRTSGDAMKHAVMAGLLAAGAACRDAGVAPTPALALAACDFDAGVMITASHNPPQYNGIKLLNPDGSSFTAVQQAQVEEAVLGGQAEPTIWQEVGHSGVYEGAVARHIDFLQPRFPEIKLRVVVDAGCGAASEVTPVLLENLGCEVIAINCTPGGLFPRPAEPTAENLVGLSKAVRENNAALGIAHDGDADRMMAVDDRGDFITGDKLLVIFARDMGAKDVVTTLDASMAIEEAGFSVRRTRIGDTAVSEELRSGGDFGGETSGSWIFPEVSLCPDGIYAAARLASIASRQRLSELVREITEYPLQRGSIAADGVTMTALEAGLQALEPRSVSRLDGIRLDFKDGWLLVRPSGTEPKIRLTAEAKTRAGLRRIYDSALRAVADSIKNKGRAD